MKKLFIYTILVLAMIGCGSNGTKYSVTDDGNGTRSPRISKTLEESFNDGNLTESDESNYTYNNQNLLIEIAGQYNTTSYKYNKNKQILDVTINRGGGAFVYTSQHYNYSQDLFMKNKLPVVVSRDEVTIFRGIANHGIREYTYKLDENGKAIWLVSTIVKTTGINSTEYSVQDIMNYHYDTDNRRIEIVHEDGGKEKISYTDFGALASSESSVHKTVHKYDKNHLLHSTKKYVKNDNNEWELIDKTTYFYEDKPYYSAPSLL